jgi:hypothetical protein
MTPFSIGSATSVYSDVSRCEIVRHTIDHPGLASAAFSLRALVQALADEAEDEYWRQTLGPIRKLAFAFCSTPLPFSTAAAATGVDWSKLQRQVSRCQQLFPDSHRALAGLVQQLEALSQENTSPLIVPLATLNARRSGLSVVMRNPRMHQAVAAHFSASIELRGAGVVSPLQLRGGHFCDTLAVIGPCNWFPEYIFTAPRATEIHVISFRWIRDGWKPGPIFLTNPELAPSKGRNHRIGKLPPVRGEQPQPAATPADILPADLIPPFPAFNRRVLNAAGTHHGVLEETAEALLCHLSGSRAVLLAADEGASALVIDTTETGRASVRRVPTGELEPGLYLLLRTSGGGGFIAPLADRILGAAAAKCRSHQAEWKSRLIASVVERFGPVGRRQLAAKLSSVLQPQGVSSASPANVHYWMSSKCIRPRKAEDFMAVLRFAGLEARAKELLAAMDDIDRAHKRAGFLIRRMLLQQIGQVSLDALERDGEMVFDLGDHDGGTLSAFLITGIEKEPLEVAADQIEVLMDAEDEAWLA